MLCAARAHVLPLRVGWRGARTAGIQLRPLADAAGALDRGAIDAVAGDPSHHLPPIVALAIENTYMPASGRPWRPTSSPPWSPRRAATTCACTSTARASGTPRYRTGQSPPALCAGVDTLMFCLSKGLSAPVGSILCGPRDLIDRRAATCDTDSVAACAKPGCSPPPGSSRSRRWSNASPTTTPGRARLADVLADRFPGSIDPATVRDQHRVRRSATRCRDDVVERLGERNVRVGAIDASTVRFVTHKDVDDDGFEQAITALDELARETS